MTGPDDRYQPPAPGGHWQYQDPYAAPPAAPPSAFPYAPPAAFPYAPQAQYPLPVMAMQPVYTMPLATNGLATAAMVLGIISIPGMILVFFDLPIAIVGLILGIVGLRRANRMPRHLQVGKGKAVAGIACASVGLMLATLFSIYIVSEYDRCSEYVTDSPAWDRCYFNEPE
ncbi:MAG: hypothetical protein JWN61_1909 [Pseudonocardiales bacterium]|nr:hypothetical protein [Pseudonocardiales bacterium]